MTWEEQVAQLYKLPSSSHWVVANSELFQDLGILGTAPTYGPRGRLIRKLVGLSAHGGMLLLVRLVGLIDAVRWWWRAGRPDQSLPAGCRIFVGFGAGPEEQMWHRFVSEVDAPAVHLDQTRAATFGQYYRPSLGSLWAGVWRHSREMVDFLSRTTVEPIASYRADFVTFATMRLAQYVFFLLWWKGVPAEQIEQAVFISADTPAFSCLDAGFSRVEFRQHGLLRKSVLMPPFPEMRLLTEDEMAYFDTRLPGTRIALAESHSRVAQHRPLLLFASSYDDAHFSKQDDLEVIEALLAWAQDAGLHVVVRRHPREDDDFWRSRFPQLEIDKVNDAFEAALMRLRPMFVATWFSTVLIDALRCNVVPVSVSAADNRHVRDLIVRLSDRCLMWPGQQPLMDDIVHGSLVVDDAVRQLASAKGAKRGA